MIRQACVVSHNVGHVKHVQNFGIKFSREERYHLREVGEDERIILKRV
jgi:hypothetical protein